MTDWITKHEVANLLGIHPNTVNIWREKHGWIEGVHFTRYGKFLYNRQLLEHLKICGGKMDDPEHVQRIRDYLLKG